MDENLPMDRRGFIKFITVFTLAIVAPHSANSKEVKRLLENEDRPGFNIRFVKPIEPLDPATWTLKVGGLCEKPLTLTLADLKQLKKASQSSRLKCVESWSSRAKWGGFRMQALIEAAKPKPEAKFLYFSSADGYYEYIPIKELSDPRVLFAYEMNDAPLPDIHGAPLRLIMPAKYGYKSVKTITELKFVKNGYLGYWAERGYSNEATVEPGIDRALDLNTYKLNKEPGEITAY